MVFLVGVGGIEVVSPIYFCSSKANSSFKAIEMVWSESDSLADENLCKVPQLEEEAGHVCANSHVDFVHGRKAHYSACKHKQGRGRGFNSRPLLPYNPPSPSE